MISHCVEYLGTSLWQVIHTCVGQILRNTVLYSLNHDRVTYLQIFALLQTFGGI